MIRTVKDYEKLSEQYNKMIAERNSLIDDLSWYKAKVNRLEQRHSKLVDENTILQNELYTMGLNQSEAGDKIKKLERENKDLRLQSDTYFEQWQNEKLTSQGLREQCKEYAQDATKFLNLLSEISQHIGNKPSSSTYKYFRAKLDALEIREDTEFTVTKPMTELQLTKDSSVQGVPLTNEAYEKAIKEGE